MHFLDLPSSMIQDVLSYLSYDEIAQARLVSRDFNDICKDALNHGCKMVIKKQYEFIREIKSQLPRRESVRRNNEAFRNLSNKYNILWCMETRLNALRTTYDKFIQIGLCCFIPGKILDEVERLMKELKLENTELHSMSAFLSELRDLCMMATEHFHQEIVPGLNWRFKDIKFEGINSIYSCLPSLKKIRNDINDNHKENYKFLHKFTQGFQEEFNRIANLINEQRIIMENIQRELDEMKAQMNIEEELPNPIRRPITKRRSSVVFPSVSKSMRLEPDARQVRIATESVIQPNSKPITDSPITQPRTSMISKMYKYDN